MIVHYQTMPVRVGVPSNIEILSLSSEIGAKWKNLARALGIPEAHIEVVEEESRNVVEKSYQLLLLWKRAKGAEATYGALEAGLCHTIVLRKELAEKYCYGQAVPQENDSMV